MHLPPLRAIAVVPILLLLVMAVPARAAERWDAFTLAQNFNDLLALGDTIWSATTESGLLEYHRSTREFVDYTKQPSGLASNKAMVLALDRGGRLWIGTKDAGVSVLDRHRGTWGLLNRLDGLPSTSITCLRAQGDSLWIGTGAGLAVWNGEEITGRVPDGVNGSPFASDVVNGIAPLGDSLWVATSTGIYVSGFSSQLRTWELRSPLTTPTHTLRALATDGTTLMALLDDSTQTFDVASGTWITRPVMAGGAAQPVSYLSDRTGAILACTLSGTYRWDTVAGWVLFKSLGVPVLTVDETGLAAGANAAGLYVENSADHTWLLETPPHPPSNSLVDLVLDHGLVYVGTEGNGAGRFDGRSWRLWLPGSSCAAPDDTCMNQPGYVYAMTMDRNGKKWFASWNSCIEEFDDLAVPPNYTHIWLGAPGPNLRTFAWTATADLAGGMWFGLEKNCEQAICDPTGIDYYDPTGTFRGTIGPPGKVHSLTVDPDGYVWAGYANPGKLVRFKPPVDPSAPVIYPGADTLQMNFEGLAAQGRYVWALSDFSTSLGGLFRFNLDDLRDTLRFATVDVVPDFAMHALEVGPDGTVWVGSRSGLRRFPAPATPHNFIDYTAENSPLVDDRVRAIRVDPQSGVVWIATAGGLSRFDPNYIPSASAPPTLDLRIYPNPAMISGGARLRLAKRSASDPGGITSGTIYDVAGRHVCDFQVDLGRPDPQVFWDGHDDSGRLVRAGIYFVRIRVGNRAATMRVALVR